jgi:hypothetical protein
MGNGHTTAGAVRSAPPGIVMDAAWPRGVRLNLRSGQSGVRSGVAGVVLAFLTLAVLQAITVPPFLAADETPHTGYALLLGQGMLPRLDTPTPLQEIPGMPQQFVDRRRVYTANHPPLYYALVAGPLRLGIRTGHPVVGFVAARLLGVMLAAAGIVAVAFLTRLLVPARPQLAVAAAGIAALLPSFLHLSALIHNDGLGFATATFTLALSVLVLTRGPTRHRLLGLALAAAAAASTRSSGLLLAGMGVVAACGGTVLHLKRPLPNRVALGIAHGGFVAAVVACLSGWFYVRNVRLYGDFMGVSANLDRFGYQPHGSVHELLSSPAFLGRIYDHLWGRFAGLQLMTDGRFGRITDVIGLGIALGLVIAAARCLRARRRPASLSSCLTWTLILVLPPLMLVLLADYVTHGGGAHARYLYPALAVLAVVTAVALDHLPGRQRGLPLLGMLGVLAGLNLAFWAGFVARTTPGQPTVPAAVAQRIEEAGLPSGPTLAAVAVLLTVAVAVMGRAVWVLSRQTALAGREAADEDNGRKPMVAARRPRSLVRRALSPESRRPSERWLPQ